MQTIQARVNPRLLEKANRLFTGTLSGRIIEILQNARRAGATEVQITSKNGTVTVRDNGRGIADFATLLDLGGSDWDEKYEASEDPAGVGLFCLAPREVVARSCGKLAVIEGDGWRGEPVEIHDDAAAPPDCQLPARIRIAVDGDWWGQFGVLHIRCAGQYSGTQRRGLRGPEPSTATTRSGTPSRQLKPSGTISSSPEPGVSPRRHTATSI